MSRAMTLFSTNRIGPGDLQQVMDHLKATRLSSDTWRLVRNERWVEICLDPEEVEVADASTVQQVIDLLGRPPQSAISLLYLDHDPDRFEFRMAKAVSIAVAELWRVVLDDHLGNMEVVVPPS